MPIFIIGPFPQEVFVAILDLAAAVIESLAWPVAGIVVVLVFHAPMKRWLSQRPRKLKLGPWEVEWEEEATSLAESLTAYPGERVGTSKVDDLWRLVRDAPVAAIVQRAVDLERQVYEVLDSIGERTPVALTKAATILGDRGIITDETYSSIRRLARLRSIAVHESGGATTSAQAREFVLLANEVQDHLADESP